MVGDDIDDYPYYNDEEQGLINGTDNEVPDCDSRRLNYDEAENDEDKVLIMDYLTTEQNAGSGTTVPDQRFQWLQKACGQDVESIPNKGVWLHQEVIKFMLKQKVMSFVVCKSDANGNFEQIDEDTRQYNVAVRLTDTQLKKEKKAEDDGEDKPKKKKEKKAKKPDVPQYHLYQGALVIRGNDITIRADMYTISGVDFRYQTKSEDEYEYDDNVAFDPWQRVKEADDSKGGVIEPIKYIQEEDLDYGPAAGVNNDATKWPLGPGYEGFFRVEFDYISQASMIWTKLYGTSLIEAFVVYVFMTWCTSIPDTCVQNQEEPWKMTCTNFTWANPLGHAGTWKSPAMKAYYWLFQWTFLGFFGARVCLLLIPKFIRVGKFRTTILRAVYPIAAVLPFVLYLIYTMDAMQSCSLCSSCSAGPYHYRAPKEEIPLAERLSVIAESHPYALWTGKNLDTGKPTLNQDLTKTKLLKRLEAMECTPVDAKEHEECQKFSDNLLQLSVRMEECPLTHYEAELKESYTIAVDKQKLNKQKEEAAAQAEKQRIANGGTTPPPKPPKPPKPMSWQTANCKYWSKKLPPIGMKTEEEYVPGTVADLENEQLSYNRSRLGYVFWNGQSFELPSMVMASESYDTMAYQGGIPPTDKPGWYLVSDVGYCNPDCNHLHEHAAKAKARDPVKVQNKAIHKLWGRLGCPCWEDPALAAEAELEAQEHGVGDPLILDVLKEKKKKKCKPPHTAFAEMPPTATPDQVKEMRHDMPTWIPRMWYWPTLGAANYSFACFAKKDWPEDWEKWQPGAHLDGSPSRDWATFGDPAHPFSPEKPDGTSTEWDGKCVYYNVTYRAACVCAGNGRQVCYANAPSAPLGAKLCASFNSHRYRYGANLQYGGTRNTILGGWFPFVSAITGWVAISKWLFLTIAVSQLSSSPFGSMDKDEKSALTKATIDILDSFLFTAYIKKYGVSNALVRPPSQSILPQFWYARGWYDAIWWIWLLAILSTILSVSLNAIASYFDVDKLANYDPAKQKVDGLKEGLEDDLTVLQPAKTEEEDIDDILEAQAKAYEKAIGTMLGAHTQVWIMPGKDAALTWSDPSTWLNAVQNWTKVEIVFASGVKDAWADPESPDWGVINLFVTSAWPWNQARPKEEMWEAQDEAKFEGCPPDKFDDDEDSDTYGIMKVKIQFDEIFLRVRPITSYGMFDCRYLGWCFYIPRLLGFPNGFQPRFEVDFMTTMDTRVQPVYYGDDEPPERDLLKDSEGNDIQGAYSSPTLFNTSSYDWSERTFQYLDTVRSFLLVDLPFFIVRFYWDWYHPPKLGAKRKFPLLMLKNFIMCVYDFFYLIACGNTDFECCGVRVTSNVAQILTETSVGRAVKVGIMPEATISQQAAGILFRKPMEHKLEDLTNHRLLLAYKRYKLAHHIKKGTVVDPDDPDTPMCEEDPETGEMKPNAKLRACTTNLDHEIGMVSAECDELAAMLGDIKKGTGGKVAAKVKLK